MFIATPPYFLVGASHIAGLGGRAQTIMGTSPDTLDNVNNMSSRSVLRTSCPL